MFNNSTKILKINIDVLNTYLDHLIASSVKIYFRTIKIDENGVFPCRWWVRTVATVKNEFFPPLTTFFSHTHFLFILRFDRNVHLAEPEHNIQFSWSYFRLGRHYPVSGVADEAPTGPRPGPKKHNNNKKITRQFR